MLSGKLTIVSLLLAMFLLGSPLHGENVFGEVLIDHSSSNLGAIPDNWIKKAQSDLHIVYHHTSHGSQLITGMNALKEFTDYPLKKYDWKDDSRGNSFSLSLDDIYGNDLSQGDSDDNDNGIANWAEDTADFLESTENYHVNVIMWSWCSIEGHNIQRYLDSMEWLIARYSEGGSRPRAFAHPVQFVFMTGHAEGDGENGARSDAQNRLIRAHCAAHDRILFDFADLENYDPDNKYFLDKYVTDALYYDSNADGNQDANWAEEYITRHDGSELDRLTTGNGVSLYNGCASCAHSEGPNHLARLNCVLKGRAAWHLFARLAGWQRQEPGPVDNDPPVRTSGKPTGNLAFGTTQVIISLATNESSTCKYATIPNLSFADMPETFSGSGTMAHTALVTGLVDGTSCSFFVRCEDNAGNSNDDDYAISFNVDLPPPTNPIAIMPPIYHLMLH